MKKKIFYFVFVVLCCPIVFAQVGIGTNTPHPSASLEIVSTTKGFLPPRLTKNQLLAISQPVEGLTAYCTDCTPIDFYYYNGNEFLSLGNDAPLEPTILSAIQLIVDNSDDPADGNPTIADLIAVNVTGTIPANIDFYEVAIANASPAPVSVLDLQTIIDYVNASVVNNIISQSTYPAAGGSPSIAYLSSSGLTGLVANNQPAYEAAIIRANPLPTSIAEIQTIINTVNTAILDSDNVMSPTGRIWNNKNIGATQVATSVTDANAYGNLYQWGRKTDGHQVRTGTVLSATTNTPVTAGTEGNQFIRNTTAPNNWLTPQDDSRWQSDVEPNNPCPTNFRVPTETEWNIERTTLNIYTMADGFASPLKLTAAGRRGFGAGSSINNAGLYGYYWTSTVSGDKGMSVFLKDSDFVDIQEYGFASGHSVRCIMK